MVGAMPILRADMIRTCSQIALRRWSRVQRDGFRANRQKRKPKIESDWPGVLHHFLGSRVALEQRA